MPFSIQVGYLKKKVKFYHLMHFSSLQLQELEEYMRLCTFNSFDRPLERVLFKEQGEK